jgi:hypothetical protein
VSEDGVDEVAVISGEERPGDRFGGSDYRCVVRAEEDGEEECWCCVWGCSAADYAVEVGV